MCARVHLYIRFMLDETLNFAPSFTSFLLSTLNAYREILLFLTRLNREKTCTADEIPNGCSGKTT